MTQKHKQLLLKDLCARLPYGVFVNAKSIGLDEEIFEVNVRYGMLRIAKDICTGESKLVPIFDVKPYLRPMSSMTEEEKKEYNALIKYLRSDIDDNELAGIWACKINDFYNKNHFDYRELIPMGLALEASEGMYKTE